MNDDWINKIFNDTKDGFYIEIDSDPKKDINSKTYALSEYRRWRGFCFTKLSGIDRTYPFKVFSDDLSQDPVKLPEYIYENYPGTMIHYLYINKINNLEVLFETLYEYDIEKSFSHKSNHCKLNIITLEIVADSISEKLSDILINKFDLRFYEKADNSYRYINEVYSILV